jgi:hypothetical protein
MVDTKRRIIKLLPEINQTPILKKFFAATVDHLMQPESVEFLTGYIGSKPSYYNPSTDYYVNEPTIDRTNYQLPVTAISDNVLSGFTNNIMFYDDIINQLAFDGANVNNHSRLFEQEYYSWAPPIDLDKLVNYTRYVWLPQGPSPIQLLNQTNAAVDIIGQQSYTYTGAYLLTSTNQIVIGSLQFTTGLAIILMNDVDYNINGVEYIVNINELNITLNVGPVLINPAWDIYGWNFEGWDGNSNVFTPMYTTINRWSNDQNQWSLDNSWYHIDVITLSQTPLLDYYSAMAQRPIIEINPNITLWDYGFYGRPPVDIVMYNISNVFATVVGKSIYVYDGITLADGMRILITGDTTKSNVNNRIFTVTGIDILQSIELTIAADGQNPNGSPTYGDRVDVKFGVYQEYNFWFTANGIWRWQGQQYSLTSAPLFDLFNEVGTSLSNPVTYPNNNFAGNQIFSYINNPATSPIDTVLNINAQRDSFGALQFNNGLTSTSVGYTLNGTKQTYLGYIFYQIISNVLTNSVTYNNDWHKAAAPSRQYILNDYLNLQINSAIISTTLNIDQLPAPYVIGELPPIIVILTRNGTQSQLVNGTDYVVTVNNISSQPQVVIAPGTLITSDRVTISSWSTSVPKVLTGYYELPTNLTANPNNKDITVISQGQLIDHFVQIMQNQYGFTGVGLGDNNYRDTYKDLSLGQTILQHRAPMLKMMILNSSNVATGPTTTISNTNPLTAIQFAQREYTRFYSKFIRALFNLYNNGYSVNNAVTDWLTAALKQVNVGKTLSSPWSSSGYSNTQGGYTFQQSATPNYIPPTATRLGVTPAYQPTVYYIGENLVIQTHDGSRIVMEDNDGNPLGTILGGYVTTQSPILLSNGLARAWLQFELNLFDNMPIAYSQPESPLVFDIRTFIPGKWRTNGYSQAEFLAILQPMFDKWNISNQVDYAANTTFDLNDQFSWNYSNQLDQQGQFVPGNWRGIYRWFYDTDRPNICPWEMLGFSQQPTWWTTEYGAAPYTNGNTYMWNDLANGIIRQGSRQGTYTVWARPGLLNCIPADDQGNLLPPNAAGTVQSLPTVYQARAEWVFGDGGPIESVWVHSQEYNFVLAQLGYLMKPAQFIEYCWDTLRTEQLFAGTTGDQWIYLDTNSRRGSDQFYVQRENPSTIGQGLTIPNETNLTYYQSGGIQHWISEYLISQSINITNYFGNIVRGCLPKLAHRVGAYINSNTDLRVTVDSFGVIGYKTNLVPSENVNVYLYRSTSTGTVFYGGAIIKQVSGGWQVYGYDAIEQQFYIIPSSITGGKVTATLGNVNVIRYLKGMTSNGQPIIQSVPYGTIFATQQLVYDFLISIGRFQENQGWIFDEYNAAGNNIANWGQGAADFIYWSQVQWANGNFISISPLANAVKYHQEFGNIEFINGIIGGTYPIVDRAGFPINTYNLEILRYDGEITVQSLNTQAVYGLRLFTTTLEHVIVFDNQTSFGDTIYDDLYNLAQPRLKIYAYRTNDWTGRLDVPGYFLYQNPVDNTWAMISNFEKTTNDFRKYFNIDQPKNFDGLNPLNGNVTTLTSQNSVIDRSDISDLAKHLFGYQQRTYLEDLIYEDSTEFQFYQGFIRQKGTTSAINAITRNTAIIPAEETFEYFEEFALRIGRYGASALNTNIDFILVQHQFVNDPQQIALFGDMNSDREINGIIEFIQGDPRFIIPPTTWTSNRFALRTYYGANFNTDLPTAGYVELGEPDWLVANITVLTNLYSTNVQNQFNNISNVQIQDRDTIWQFIDSATVWTIWEFTLSPAQIDYTVATSNPGSPTLIACKSPHDLVNGDLVTLVGISNASVLNNQTVVISNVNQTGTTFTVPTTTFIAGSGGNIYAYRRIRFGNVTLRDDNPPVGGWIDGDKAYVDLGDVGINGWNVYQMYKGTWISIRSENLKVEPSLMLWAKLYSKTTLNMLVTLDYFDPVKGYIPGIANVGLDYKSTIDPAQYNKGNTSLYPMNPNGAWEDNHVGETWWDLSAVRYIDYEIGADSYRWQNWGQIAPGTSINIYEWVRSPVSPTSWASYVSSGQTFSLYGINYSPSGIVRNVTNPAWTQTVEYNSIGTAGTWYYFWVMNATTLPLPANRTLTTLEMANTIGNPSAYGASWWAAIDPNNLLVSGVSSYLNDTDTVMQILYTQKANNGNDHKQWTLVRSGDLDSTIDNYFWIKMHDSLVGFDGLGNNVPDTNLDPTQRYGTLIRPRQSWFKNQQMAIQIYVTTVNNLLSNLVVYDNPNIANWTYFFNQQEQIPTEPNVYTYIVSSITERNNIGASDGETVLVLPTIDTNYLWVIYQWEYSSQTWIAIRVQEYNTTAYWDYVDWYSAADGITSNTIPSYVVPNEDSLQTLVVPTGTIAQVENNGANLWELWLWDGIKWDRVGLQTGTIQLLPSLYDGSAVNISDFNQNGFDSLNGFDISPTTELSNIINGIRFAIFGTTISSNTIELNQIFFAMINYVLSEQTFVDWIFKTSHIILEGFNNPVYTGELYQSDNISDLLAYINEIRPYRSKIRQFISSRSAQDNVSIYTTDFDLPVYNGEVLDVSNPVDANIIASTSTSQAWYNNYQTNPSLIRTIKSTILFDRVASLSKGWNVGGWSSLGWQYEGGATPSYGAFDRIQQYYNPIQGMIPRYSDELISGTAYKGVILSGLGFNTDLGWAASPWNSIIGWDGNKNNFDNYLDLIISGGVSPVYDTFYGNGINTSFNLTRVPVDIPNTAVWSNNILRVYGTDWIIPSWLAYVNIIVGGTGYEIGEIVILNVSPNVSPAKMLVSSIDVNGGITSLTIFDKGKYDVVPSGDVTLSYPSTYIGFGSDAIIKPFWGGRTVLFNVAPSASITIPSVYVLFSGETFEPAPTGDNDIIFDGFEFIQPYIAEDHAEELYSSKLTSSMRIDVYSSVTSGHPIIYTRMYITNGITSQFDCGIRPQDESSTIVSLNNSILMYGDFNDYTVNFKTNKVVLNTIPAAQSKLQIITIGSGGAGLDMAEPFVVTPGTNYAVGDIITLAGGYGSLANVIVDTVQVSPSYWKSGWDILEWEASPWCYLGGDPANIIVAGSNFAVGDELILANDGNTIVSVQAMLTITSTALITGAILEVELTEPGSYTVVPVEQVWETTGTGINSDIAVAWGASTLSLHSSGYYLYRPTQPISQLNTTGIGYNLTIDATYTASEGTNIFKGTGNTNVFSLTFAINSAENLLVTVDGVVQEINTIIASGSNVTLINTPPLNSLISVTGFNTSYFSVVNDEQFTATAGTYFYQLFTFPGSSVPPYNSMLVLRNGKALIPPLMDNFISNGIQTIYNLSFTPTSLDDFYFYLENINYAYNEGYHVVGNQLQLSEIPPAGARISVVYQHLAAGMQYSITGNYIFVPTVEAGDTVRIITFTEDYSYGWVIDNSFISTPPFTGPNAYYLGNGEYQLAQVSYDQDSIMVFVDGNLQALMTDFTFANNVTIIETIPNTISVSGNAYILTTSNVASLSPGMIVVGNTLPTGSYIQSITTGNVNSILLTEPALDTGMFTMNAQSIKSVVSFNSEYAPTPTTANVVIAYTTFPESKPPIAWRTLVQDNGISETIAIDNKRKTNTLSAVYVYTTEIQIADLTAIGPAPGAVWIGNELIQYSVVQRAPLTQYLNSGFISGLNRGSGVTSNLPLAVYDTLYYYGDGVTRYFPAASGTLPIAETVYVNNIVQPNLAYYSTGTYVSTSDNIPDNLPPGRYIVFNIGNIPPPGWRNVRIVSLTTDFNNNSQIHISGSEVIDAGRDVQLPDGYQWEPAPYGLQYSNSRQAQFLLDHSGSNE